jgi:phosphate/sulfate permease
LFLAPFWASLCGFIFQRQIAMLNWQLLKTWENWLIIPMIAFFFAFFVAIVSDYFLDKEA